MSFDQSDGKRLTIGVSPMVKKVMEGFKISRAVRTGDWLFTNGQMDIGDNAKVLNPDDMLSQSVTCMRSIYELMARTGCHLSELAQIQVFYLADGIKNEEEYLAQILEEFPECCDSIVLLTPVPSFATVGHVVEIDAIAVKGNRAQVFGSDGYTSGVRRGEWVFAASKSNLSAEEAFSLLASSMNSLGAELKDVCRVYAYYGAELSLNERLGFEQKIAQCFGEYRPAFHATLLPDNRIAQHKVALEVIANTNSSLEKIRIGSVCPASSGVEWPFSDVVRCGEAVFVSGQFPIDEFGEIVDSENIAMQARVSMRSISKGLAEVGAQMSDLVKIKTYYQGAWDMENWFDNLRARMELLSDPGPASSGIEGLPPVKSGALLSVDGIAILDDVANN